MCLERREFENSSGYEVWDDFTVIALYLGHTQTSTSDMYSHIAPEATKNVLDKTRQPDMTSGNYMLPVDVLTWLENV